MKKVLALAIVMVSSAPLGAAEGGLSNYIPAFYGDLGLAMEIARGCEFDNPMGQLAEDLYQEHQKDGSGQRDFSSILQKLQGA